MSPIKIGFVGLSSTGWASMALAPGLLRPSLTSKYTLTAVSTTSAASANTSAAKWSEQVGHKVKPFHGDTAQVAGDPDVELVIVAVRAPEHKATLLPAIQAGKNIFVEWPAGVGLKECQEIADAAAKKGIRTMVGLQGRQASTVKKVKEIVSSGKIGKILSFSIIAMAPQELLYWGPEISERNTYTADATQGANMLHIAIGHQLSVLTHVLGDFASISATTATMYPTATVLDANRKPTGQTISVTGADHVAFNGILKSGALASVIWRGGLPSTKGRKQFIWVIDGEEGSIKLESDDLGGAFLHIRDPDLYLNGDLVEVEKAGSPTDILADAWEEFAKGEGGDYATIEDAVKNHRILDAISRSAEEGRRIILD